MKYIAILIIVITIISCTDKENSVKSSLNNKIEYANNIDIPLKFKLVYYYPQSKSAKILIECDFNKIDSSDYLNQLTKIENILNKEGIVQVKYNIVNKSEDNYQIEDKLISKNKLYNTVLKNNAIINHDFVRLRLEPNRQSNIISYLFDGTVVKIIDNDNKSKMLAGKKNYWYLIKTKDHKQGWVFGEYLSETNMRLISSSFKNNKIYDDFLKKKKLLVPIGYNKLRDSVKIHSNNIVLNTKNKNSFQIPFQIVDDKVRWKISDSRLLPVKTNSFIKKNNAKLKQNIINKKKYIPHKLIPVVVIDEAYVKPYNKTKNKPINKQDKNYNLKIDISPYFKSQANKATLSRIKAVMKIVEARLILKDYKKDISFYSKFNPINDTVKITIKNIDFDNKKTSVYIKRIDKELQKDIAKDIWLIDFNDISKLKQNLNFKEMSEPYYIEILVALSHIRSDKRKGVIGLANYIVDKLTKQKYL